MTQITVTNEIFINLGNTGTFSRASQSQSFALSFATPSGIYLRAGLLETNAFNTAVFYVSGTVVEGGDIVTLTPNGDVPAEFNGKTLVTDAVVITPEIFLDAQALANPDDPEPAPTPNPPLSDGKVADPLNVIILLHADSETWFDSSTYTRAILAVGTPDFDPLRKAFGTGSLKLTSDVGVNSLGAVVTDDELFALEDDSFTFEARIRLDSVAAKTHTLFSFGDGTESFFDLRLELDPASSDKVVFNWLRPAVAGESDPSYSAQIELPIASGKFLAKPDVFQQFAFVYDKIQGHFAAYLDGERVGFVDASAFTNPTWGGLFVLPVDAAVDGELSVGSLVPLAANPGSQFAGHLDEVRLTLREALYQTVSPSAAVYTFAWPDPIVFTP